MYFMSTTDIVALSFMSGMAGILFSLVLAYWRVVPGIRKMRERLLVHELVKTSEYQAERGLASRALTYEEASAWVKTLTPPIQRHFLENPIQPFLFHGEPFPHDDAEGEVPQQSS